MLNIISFSDNQFYFIYKNYSINISIITFKRKNKNKFYFIFKPKYKKIMDAIINKNNIIYKKSR